MIHCDLDELWNCPNFFPAILSSTADHLSFNRREIPIVVLEIMQFEVLRAEACISESTRAYYLKCFRN